MKVIETIHLTKNYGKNLALKNVNLIVNTGEIFGLVGPKGAGKSTFIKLLLNFIFPNIGHSKIFNLNSVNDSAKIKEQIGYVPADPRYYPNATAEGLLKYTLAFHHKESFNAIDPLCEALDIDKAKRFGDLSMGNKKKVAIACAVIHEPRLIILDEPTNGLDALMQKRFFEMLKDINKKGTTIFLASQNIMEVQDHCTRIAFIKDGRIIKTEDLTKPRKSTKIIEITGDSIDLKALQAFGGRILTEHDNKVRFSYQGDAGKLMKILGELELKDISINNASLEVDLLNYYEGGLTNDALEIGI